MKLSKTQQRLVERAAVKIPPLAKRMARGLPGVTADELTSVGYEALTIAATRYDADSGVPFSGYAYYRARGAMIDAARSRDPEARRHQRAVKVLATTQSVLEEAQRREGAAAENNRRTLRERVEAAARLVEATAAGVLLAHSDGLSPDLVTDESTHTQVLLEQAEVQECVAAAVAKLPEEDREVIDALFNRGQTMVSYAKEHTLATSTVSRRVGKILERLAETLSAQGIGPPRAPP